ncbi:hypothetical protein EDEG_00994 [Edhazardia aedis USNM 41457]|uniref:Uncharacterized protein n=1 Tax=Edhazardia aedis (strain USNM 41457) TaxID=1003232 RepID=J9DBF0_EDHAE|nr:hypothetical protein EDEG_00994 [Edhazardia aedis USNM 41457]|eukprot:EJW04824.1 hypothetical protein EDEG_00994 [Edhazardia aedis USNM 41457]
MTQNYYFLMFNTNRFKGVQARDEVMNKNQLSSDNSRRVCNIVEYFLQYNQVPSCNSTNICIKKLKVGKFEKNYKFPFIFLYNINLKIIKSINIFLCFIKYVLNCI